MHIVFYVINYSQMMSDVYFSLEDFAKSYGLSDSYGVLDACIREWPLSRSFKSRCKGNNVVMAVGEVATITVNFTAGRPGWTLLVGPRSF